MSLAYLPTTSAIISRSADQGKPQDVPVAVRSREPIGNERVEKLASRTSS